MAKTASKKRKVIVESIGEAHVTASFNNIIISLTNTKGEVISWSSAGKMGFRGSKKNTPYAAQTAAEDCAKVAQEAGLRKVKVFVKGPGSSCGSKGLASHSGSSPPSKAPARVTCMSVYEHESERESERASGWVSEWIKVGRRLARVVS